MAITIRRVLVEAEANPPGQAVTVTDQATGTVLGTGTADPVTGVVQIAVPFALFLQAVAGGKAAAVGAPSVGASGTAAGGGVGGGTGTLSQQLPISGAGGGHAGGAAQPAQVAPEQGAAGGQAGATGALGTATSPALSGSAGGQASDTGTLSVSAAGVSLSGSAGGRAGGEPTSINNANLIAELAAIRCGDTAQGWLLDAAPATVTQDYAAGPTGWYSGASEEASRIQIASGTYGYVRRWEYPTAGGAIAIGNPCTFSAWVHQTSAGTSGWAGLGIEVNGTRQNFPDLSDNIWHRVAVAGVFVDGGGSVPAAQAFLCNESAGGACDFLVWGAKLEIGSVATGTTSQLAPGQPPPPGFTDTFSDSSLNTAHWTSGTASGGTVTETTKLALAATTTAAVAAIGYKSSWAKASAETLKLDFKIVTTSYADERVLHIQQASAQPSLGVASATQNQLIYFRFNTTGNSLEAFYRDSGGSYTQAGTSYSQTNGNTYRLIYESTSTQWRMRVMSVDEVTTYKDFGWINWSSCYDYSGSPLWAIIGDPWTDYMTVNEEIYRFESNPA